MNRPMMGCGHAANAHYTDSNGVEQPSCVICVGIVAGAKTVVETPNLEGRMARCSYGAHKDVPSSMKLAFFEHHPDQEFDRYYCGCYGWD